MARKRAAKKSGAKKGKYVGFKGVKAAAKKGGARNPGAVAASIGRKKYGSKGMARLAAQGRKKSTKNTHAARKARASRVQRGK